MRHSDDQNSLCFYDVNEVEWKTMQDCPSKLSANRLTELGMDANQIDHSVDIVQEINAEI
ncbi:MAG TPA: hypothetical protein VFU37_11800 [Pyrinomonadaceae bacterium]|nr:hypothetical protein [Pyrinomonadaceae bacterium]